MKKLLLIAFVAIFGMSYAYSQTFVSTTPQPRNVILEEFTGIYCGFCPDGHKRANDLVKANPGKVFVVNIHAGSYAVPGPGDPDFRTTDGAAIDKAAFTGNPQPGYPAGSVNRSTSPSWTMGRDKWAGVAATIMAQTSPVNVAVKSSVDMAKRELTTEVEVYYTSNSAKPTNNLTVMLTQSDIRGYQADNGNWNPTNWDADGNYKHNHAFRMMISPGAAFGETITTTTTGTFVSKKYVTALPEIIGNIDLYMYNLEVVAFVAEGQSNILSGDGAEVTFDESKTTDLSMVNLTKFPTDYCFTSINPKIEVTNNTDNAITSFDVSLNLNGAKDYVKSFSGTLNKGEKTTIDWGEIQYSAAGTYSIGIKGFKNINNNVLFDVDFSNDKFEHNGIGFTKKAFSKLLLGFENSESLINLAFDISQNNQFYLLTPGMGLTFEGAKNTQNALMFPIHANKGVAGKPLFILLGECELSKLNNPQFSYYYAYSDDAFGGTAPTVKVQYSEDCSTNWIDLNATTLIQTGVPATHGNYYGPKSSEYKTVDINLANIKDKNVLFRISVIPGTSGNDMYLDEISVGEGATDVEENTDNVDYVIYPNPADFEVRLGGEMFLGMEYSIYSLVGEQLAQGINNNNRIDISNLAAGTYVIRINNETLRFVKK